MFVSQEHHPQLLAPDCYRSTEQFDSERARLMHTAWHCVGVIDELPRDGSFRTLDLLGNPIVLWRQASEVQAYLNVCAHRSCLVTSQACGTAERLKCQYHGWEFDQAGNVRKIPDARSFRPLAPGMLGLKRYRAATCGRLVFVNLSDSPVDLRSFLGEKFATLESWFTDGLHLAVTCDREIAANWKVLVENALESYHTTEVHPKSFGPMPDEKTCRHSLNAQWTSLLVDYADEQTFRRRLDDFGHWMVGAKPAHQYEHVLVYPNLMFSRLSLYRWVECVLPLAPGRSRSVVRVLCNAGTGRSPLAWWNAFWVKRWARSFLMQVGAEDAAVMPLVQQGLEAGDRPLGGLISAREERIFHFQRYVQSQLMTERRPSVGSSRHQSPEAPNTDPARNVARIEASLTPSGYRHD